MIFIGKFTDFTNQKLNNWNIEEHLGFNKHGESLWSATCDCEHETRVEKILSSLKRFGCCSYCVKAEKLKQRKLEIIGNEYGKLTIVDYYGYREDLVTKTPYWIARCDCGSDKEILSTLYDVQHERIRSCGCLDFKKPDMTMIGRKFNRLTVNELSGKIKDQYAWSCDCECGTRNIRATTNDLRSDTKRSCGCLTREIQSINGKIYGKRRKKFNEYIEKEDHYVGITDNGEFLFDKDDYDKVLSINKYWKINNIGYVLCYLDNCEYQMHRYVMGLGRYDAEEDIIVDHINGDKLDNRKSNLRVVHRKHNPKNCSIYSNNTSGYKGIAWSERLQKWQVSLQVDKKSIYLGIYENIDEAIEIRKAAEIKHFGEFSREYGNEVKN